MTDATPAFPPGYTPRLCREDSFAAAIAAAEQGAEDGVFFWEDRRDRCTAGVVLQPLDPLPAALTLAYVGGLALIDGFAAIAPPETAAALVWPDRLLVNEGCVGGLRVAYGPQVEKDGMADVPDWLVLAFAVRLRGIADDSPGRDLEYTTLHEEGCGAVTAAALVQSFSRYFLQWLDRWQEQGFAAIRPRYAERLRDRSVTIEASGDAWIETDGVRTWRPLREALRRPSWVLPGGAA